MTTDGVILVNKRILVINYEMSDQSQVFSHQIELVRNLSIRFSEIIVLTGSIDYLSQVPKNVTVEAFNWKQGSRMVSLYNFYRKFFVVFFRTRPNLVFSHMTEVQSALIAPLLRFLRVPHVLWYAHKKKSLFLVFNSFFVNRIVTSTKGSCPIRNRKVIAIGQAINVDTFYREIDLPRAREKFIHIGRMDPSKNIEKLIQIVIDFRKLNSNISLKLIGQPSSEIYRPYLNSIQDKYHTLSFISFENAMPRKYLPNLLLKSDVFIHAFEGSLDKSLVEATMAGIPVVTINSEYLNEFGTWGHDLNVISLNSELMAFMKASDREIVVQSKLRQELAISFHSLSNWVNELSNIFRDLMVT